MSRLRPAFTLVELLVVMAVLSVLAALLLPVLARARDDGRKASCLSNERQLAGALFLYTQDYDEYFPQTHPTGTPWTDPPDEVTLLAPWRELMEPYVTTARLFACPSDGGAPG